MIIEQDLKKVFQKLDHDQVLHIHLNENELGIKVFDGASKIFLTTRIYKGDNFIPKSVRNGIARKAPCRRTSIKTFLSINENQYRVDLNYLGLLQQMNAQNFAILMEDFVCLACGWRVYLDEQDQNDLIHVRV
ncbi:Uncharacterized protein NEOC65_000011 [Neochlamydia sp. AcF65]|uniref:hypothetical protein n=1 Tax=unclassified Neochlamydia TaxID=2643326 RepID=UPI001409EE32|nr:MULTISPECIES: hypothetical protein [unclassified Neochlamydia]MBS4164965.1 Uncharacterized protein [Neochlamydia sp. AcF65]NGY94335.1 hypothetical protein [Neochlamydia sp. AcF84]